MRALSQILAKYTAFIWALLRPLGSWGVFGIAFIDAAFLGLPLDPVVAGYIYKDQGRFWLYILMAAAGSALGSSIIYVVGSKGGELVLRRRVSHERVEQLRRRFERQEFVALLVPAMLPPPTPFKLFLLAAAVFQMRFRDYLLAIFLGRLVRFSVLAVLTLVFGPQVVALAGNLLSEHAWLFLAGLFLVMVLAVLLVMRRRRNGRASSA